MQSSPIQSRPKRLSAQRALRLITNPHPNIYSESASEGAEDGNQSDFRLSGNSESESTTDSDDANPPASSTESNSYRHDRRRRTDDGFCPTVPPISHIVPPFGRVGFTCNSPTPQRLALSLFKDELNYLTNLCKTAKHPFSFYPEAIEMNEFSMFVERQKMLFSLNSLALVPKSEVVNYMPEPVISPGIVFPGAREALRLPRYEFIAAHNVLFTGGYVKCLSWSPPFVDDEGASMSVLPCYLAVASYPNSGIRCNFSEPIINEPGLIQVWQCAFMALTEERSRPQLKPHFFLAHDWGHVTDLQWLPVPVQCAGFFGGANVNVLKRLAGISIDKSASLISGLVGHLIVASTDGFVRIILVPAIDNRPHMPEEFKLCLPTKIIAENDYTPGNVFRFKPKTVLRLAPCTDIPTWLGWPNTFTIRSEFPHRLGVGYSSGHFALYNLSFLTSHFAKFGDCLLKPILLTQLLPGPFTSLAFHPVYENIVTGLGLDRDINIWDLEDPQCVDSAALPELSWSLGRMGWGGQVVWPRTGDCLWVGRQEYLFPFTHKGHAGCGGPGGSGAVSLVGLKKPTDVPVRLRSYTGFFPLCSPVDCARYCFEKGFEPVTALAYSDAQAFLGQGDANGQIQFHSWILDPRRIMREKTRVSVQKNHRMYQWVMRRRLDQTNPVGCLENRLDALDLDATEAPFEEDIAAGCDLCGESGQLLCWHKVHEFFEFIYREGVQLQRSKFDFVNSTFSSISKLAISPNPASASWMAVGTGFGLVQLICHDQFYHPDMDTAIGQTGLAPGPAKGSFFVSTAPQQPTDSRPPHRQRDVDNGVDVSGESDATEPCTEGVDASAII